MAEKFQSRLIEAMAEMANPSKSSTATVPTRSGGKYQYKYETLDQVLGAVRPHLLAHGIGLTQRQEWDEATSSYVLKTIVFDDDNSMVLDQRPIIPFSDAQASGSWETYMRRYALRTAFGLTGEDDDGAATVNAKRQQPMQQHDKRDKWIRRIVQLRTECIQLGCTESDLDGAMDARYGTTDVQRLDEKQLLDYGKFLTQVKANSEAHQ